MSKHGKYFYLAVPEMTQVTCAPPLTYSSNSSFFYWFFSFVIVTYLLSAFFRHFDCSFLSFYIAHILILEVNYWAYFKLEQRCNKYSNLLLCMMYEFFFPSFDSQPNDMLMPLDLVPSFSSRDQSQNICNARQAGCHTQLQPQHLCFLDFLRQGLLTHSDWPWTRSVV